MSELSSEENVERVTRRTRLHCHSSRWLRPSLLDGALSGALDSRMQQPRSARPLLSSGCALNAASEIVVIFNLVVSNYRA